MAIGFSNSNNLQALASRVHPIYGVLFTVMLYLTIGPFFAAPRTGAVAYEIGFAPFISEANLDVGLFIFTVVFFGITLWLSLNPAKLVDRIGKILAPALVILLVVLLITAFIIPISAIEDEKVNYIIFTYASGFIEGYTIDSIIALFIFFFIMIYIKLVSVETIVYCNIIMNAFNQIEVKSHECSLSTTGKAAFVAVV